MRPVLPAFLATEAHGTVRSMLTRPAFGAAYSRYLAMATHGPQMADRRRPRILIHFPTVSYFGAVLRVAKAIVANDIGDAILYAATRFPGYDQLKAQADEARVKLLCPRGADLKPIKDFNIPIAELGLGIEDRPRPRKTIEMLRARQDNSFRWRLALTRHGAAAQWSARYAEQYKYWLTQHAAMANHADRVIDALGIDLFITCNETLNYNAHVFIAAMRAVGRRSLYIPISVPSINEMDGWLAKDEEARIGDRCQRIVARLFPRWVRKVRGQRLLRAPVGRILAMEGDGMAPRQPWLSFTLGSDAVGISSTFLMERLVELGAAYRRGSMFLIGSPEDTELDREPARASRLRKEITTQFSWQQDKPIVLFSPSADLTRQYGIPEFGNYHELLDYWARSLTRLRNFNVLISPHPWFQINEPARKVLEATGIAILWRKAADVIPAVDVFATFGASSTPRLAASMGLPVLNYLCFDARFRPEDDKSYFVGFDTMPVARTRVEWEALLDRLDQPAYYADLRHQAQARASFFGVQDGAFVTRLATLIETLTTGNGPLSADEIVSLSTRLAN